MILKYLGFNNNWVYEDCDAIETAELDIGNLWKMLDGTMSHGKEVKKYSDQLRSVINFIESETECPENFEFHCGYNMLTRDSNKISIVILKDKTHIFNKEVYLLNGDGKIIVKLI